MYKIKVFPFILFLIPTVIFLFSCKGESGTPPIQRPFIYEITGTAVRVDLKYQDPRRGDYTQVFNRTLPWSIELFYLEPDDVGNSYYLSAQKLESDSVGTVIVTIYVDGALQKTQQTSDSFGFVAVYGTTP